MLHSISGRANKQDAVRLRSKNHGVLRDSPFRNAMPFAKRGAFDRSRTGSGR
jgi:hypothetical protein